MLKAELIGNLGQDPEMRITPDGQNVTSFGVACNQGKDREGNEREPIWVRVSCWGKLAEITNEYLNKGSGVFVRGRIRVSEYADRTTHEKRYSLEVTADELNFIGGGRREEGDSGLGDGVDLIGESAGHENESDEHSGSDQDLPW